MIISDPKFCSFLSAVSTFSASLALRELSAQCVEAAADRVVAGGLLWGLGGPGLEGEP